MRDSGVAIMGTASAEGEDRAKTAVDSALHSPLLEDNDIRGAEHILLNITSGTKEVTMDEIFEITEFVQEEAGYGTDLIWGNCYDESLGDKISVTVIATGFERNRPKKEGKGKDNRIVVSLDDQDEQTSNRRPGLADIGFEEGSDNENTVEFENLRPTTDKYKRYSYDEPYMKGDTEEEGKSSDSDRKRKYKEGQRRRQNHDLPRKLKLNNPKTIIELENQPAYLRRGIHLDDVPSSEEADLSKWTIGDDEDADIQQNGNAYLHDNVD
jgi:cell division protein FtsZ